MRDLAIIESKNSGVICTRCGRAYSRRKGFFPVCYAAMYKGTGYLNICRECFKELYLSYLEKSDDPKLAVRQMCRKLDLYWSELLFNQAKNKAADFSLMSAYLVKTNHERNAGRSYDDTLIAEDKLWDFADLPVKEKEEPKEQPVVTAATKGQPEREVTDKMIRYWGVGYDDEDYLLLEDRLEEMVHKLNLKREELDIGTEKIAKQVCAIELDIEKARRAGKAVDRLQNSLNTYLGSANLKPSQQKTAEDSSLSNKPLGILAQIYEEKRPIPEVDPALSDVDNVVKNITTWYLGHGAKMLKKRNVYVPLYEEAMEKYRVRHPNIDGEEDDDSVDEEILDAEFNKDEES